MTKVHNWDTITKRAKAIRENVKKKYVLGETELWSYYFAKMLLKPKVSVTYLPNLKNAKEPKGDYFSRQIKQAEYLDMCKRMVKFVETNGKLPNYITVAGKKMQPREYTYLFAIGIVYYDMKGTLPTFIDFTSKVFTKPTEPADEVYNYFVKVFGKISCIDDALEKISRKGYGYYYDDKYSNKETIDRMKTGKGVNCTDSCHVFYNLGLEFVKKGKYKKVECLHVKCRGGDGHVRLRFTLPNGETFYRDPACTLSDGGTCNWCLNGTLLAVNPSWFMQNLNK